MIKKKKRALILDQSSKSEDEVSDLILGENKYNQCFLGCYRPKEGETVLHDERKV